jgi:thiol-disulfide isomerase/thioredoxin
MTSHIKAVLLVLMASPSCLAQPGRAVAVTPVSASPATGYTPVHQFDPTRDPADDIRAAIAEAQRTGKRIILYVGGPWCPFCHQMDQLFEKNPGLAQLRESHFITVAVHYGTGNIHDQALSPYPHVLGIPHFYVLESDGTLLHSQHVVDLREDGAYSPTKMKDFFNQWARPEPVAITIPK